MNKKNDVAGTGFADRLKDVMREKKLRQKDIAAYAGVSGAAVSGWIHGKVDTPDANILKKLAQRLNVSPYWLLYGEERRVSDGANKGVIPVGTFSADGDTVQFSPVRYPEFCAATSVFKDCKSVIMIGTHMEPAIKDGDVVVVDTDDKTIKNGSIYAFFANGQFIIATLNRSIFGQISASYSNPPQTGQIEDITIIGRVVKRLTDV